MHGRYTVALCDILGFSDLVKSMDLHVVVERLLGSLRKALHHSIHKDGFPVDIPSLAETDAHSEIGLVWFSDTLLLYTREDRDDCIQELFATVGWLLFETMFMGGTRIRAGIAYGDAFIDPENSLYLGMPIIEAYELEGVQQWSGASLARSAFQRIPPHVHGGDFTDWWVVPYAVPIKGGTCDTLAVNWTTGFHQPGTFLAWSPQSPEPTDDDWKKRRSICEKWKNTKEFHDSVCRHCKSLTST